MHTHMYRGESCRVDISAYRCVYVFMHIHKCTCTWFIWLCIKFTFISSRSTSATTRWRGNNLFNHLSSFLLGLFTPTDLDICLLLSITSTMNLRRWTQFIILMFITHTYIYTQHTHTWHTDTHTSKHTRTHTHTWHTDAHAHNSHTCAFINQHVDLSTCISVLPIPFQPSTALSYFCS